MDPEAPDFLPLGLLTVRPESSVGGDSDLTVTQERYNAAEAFRKAEAARALQTGASHPKTASPDATPPRQTFTFITFASRRPLNNNTASMSDNSITPRNKRLSNGPGASPADKYPEDSPTRLRHLPRFSAAMQDHRSRGQPQQHQELRVEDTEAWPSLGEASKQTRNQRRRAAHTASTSRAARRSSVSSSGSETAIAQQPVAQQPDTIAFQPQAAPYLTYQPHLPQQNLSQQYIPEHAEQRMCESRRDLVPTLPPFVPSLHAGLVTARQQQQLMTPQKQQASPFRASVPGVNSAYNFDRLAASQQAQREATVAQLHSAFFEPQSKYVQPASIVNRGYPEYNIHRGPHADQSSLHGYDAQIQAPAVAMPDIYQASAPGLNPSAQGYHLQPELFSSANVPHRHMNPGYLPVLDTSAKGHSTYPGAVAAKGPSERAHDYINSAYLPVFGTQSEGRSTYTDAPALEASTSNVPHGYVNPAYLPVFDTGAEGGSAHSGAPAPAPSANEPTFTTADYETSPPPSPHLTMLDLLDQSGRDHLTPENRPLTPNQQSGTCYGIEIGGLGVSTLGTSDRTGWLPSPWNPSTQQPDFRVRPRNHEGWGGWEWATQKGWGTDERKE